MRIWGRCLGLLLVIPLLSGCARWEKWLGNDLDSSRPGAVQPVGPIGLKGIWETSVAPSPEEHMQHPRQIVASEDAVFLATFQGLVLCVDRDDGHIRWKSDAKETIVGGVAVDKTRVFAGTRNGEMVAFSRDDGHELWRVSVSTSVASAPVVAKDTVIFLTLDNRTYALNASDGRRLWMHDTPAESLVVMGAATPTIDGGKVYVGYSSGKIFALSLEKGFPLWMEDLSVMVAGRNELEMLQDVDASVVVGDVEAHGLTKLYAVNHQGRAIALFPLNGTRVWEQPLSAIRRPLLVSKRLFFSDMEGNLVALSTEDGLSLWKSPVSGGLLTAPVFWDGKIIVADNMGQLFALDATSGRILGKDTLGDTVLADPVVDGKSLFFWTNEGDLLRYDL